LTRFPFCQRANPAAVPIQRLPSLPPIALSTLDEGNRSPFGGAHETNRTPSKRTNPASVAIQRYPSAVCAIASGSPLKAPSWILQEVCPYWEIRLLGSTAQTKFTEKDKTRKQTGNDREMCSLSTLDHESPTLGLVEESAEPFPKKMRSLNPILDSTALMACAIHQDQ
jgi:hypothetical protein